ncbi:SHC SH2 domain-binding protein 1 [Empidonax traillii]|uniref:SHC SH2 domain-binding protein 1 n=1 Tax=Empidonax traillii TaxID=164674 RepID=UPI000FFD2AF6|nr:SHC SH2 domain-binding protein 1 [Empidonax traillii]
MAMAEAGSPGPQGDGWALPPAGRAAGPQDGAEHAEGAVHQEDAESDWSADSCSDYGSRGNVVTALGRAVPDGNVLLPDIFHTDHLFFYERFSAYQDYILADCKASEVKQFIADYLEKVLEPSGWQAIWRTDVFQVVVGVVDVDYSSLKAVVQLSDPFLCESRDSSFTLECMQELLELKQYQILLQELWVVYDESGEFDQTALAVEHVSLLCLLQFHSDPLTAVSACYEGDTVIIFPGHYVVDGVFCIADSVELEGFGLPDDIVIENQGKGDNFFDCTGANVRISSLKLVQHDAVEGILNIHHGKTTLENCVLQCETTGITVRMSAELVMKNSDLYGAKGAGVEIYPGSMCTLLHNGIHHCKEGILIKSFLDEHYDVPKITMVNNVIHNNEGYGVVLVKPGPSEVKDASAQPTKGNTQPTQSGDETQPTQCVEEVRQEQQPECVTDELERYERAETSGQTEGNCEIANELGATAAKKSKMHKKRLSELGITEADENFMSQDMFISVEGNQFKWNGKGSFGTFVF